MIEHLTDALFRELPSRGWTQQGHSMERGGLLLQRSIHDFDAQRAVIIYEKTESPEGEPLLVFAYFSRERPQGLSMVEEDARNLQHTDFDFRVIGPGRRKTFPHDTPLQDIMEYLEEWADSLDPSPFEEAQRRSQRLWNRADGQP